MEKIELTNEQKYYHYGFFETSLAPLYKAMLWNEIYSTNWVADQKENLYKEIPSWYIPNEQYIITGQNRSVIERKVGKYLLSKTPISLIEAGNDLIKECNCLNFFKRYYKDFEVQYVDLWNGAEEIDFHFDTINGSDTLILIYLTDQSNWNKEWGGQISLKKQVGDMILIEQEFDPIDGRMLVINNANPLVMHKVTKMKNNIVNRYTISYNLNWN